MLFTNNGQTEAINKIINMNLNKKLEQYEERWAYELPNFYGHIEK